MPLNLFRLPALSRRPARLIRVIDGDTYEFEVQCTLGQLQAANCVRLPHDPYLAGQQLQVMVQLRLGGVNTPEIRGDEKDEGLNVKTKVEEWFAESEKSFGGVFIELSDDYSFTRQVGTVWRGGKNGESLANWLINAGYGDYC